MRRLSARPTRLTRARLRPAAVAAAVADPRRGAIASFVGVVRALHAGRRVRSVEYEAFLPLAEKELARVVAEAERRWPVRAAAVHRLGLLRVGEASVVVAAGSVHRAEALAACRWTIDEIKRRLPVWKKERYASGPGRWLAGCALGRRAR